jgi:hypothetical protein
MRTNVMLFYSSVNMAKSLVANKAIVDARSE